MAKARTLTLTIPGIPVAQPRARACIVGKHAHVYNPKQGGVGDYRNLIRVMAAEEWQGPPTTLPVYLVCLFVFPRQAVKVWKAKPMPRYAKITKPDFDNLIKLVCDSMTGIVYCDDSQIAGATIRKVHAAGDESPHAVIKLFETL